MLFLNKFKQFVEHIYPYTKLRSVIGHFEGSFYFSLYSLFKMFPFMPRWLHLHLIQAICAENKDTIKTGKKQLIHCSDIPSAQQNVYVRSLYTTTLNF